uniref:BED-type domain-containing protein n=1 Tax=Kalanchoe fedtschenkoi TaxID=63787 RepID=A0A7N0TG71_KALFE
MIRSESFIFILCWNIRPLFSLSSLRVNEALASPNLFSSEVGSIANPKPGKAQSFGNLKAHLHPRPFAPRFKELPEKPNSPEKPQFTQRSHLFIKMQMEIVALPLENVEPPSPGTGTGRKRRKKSVVWDHFTLETVSPGCTRATCNHCKKSFAYISGAKQAGTSHLKRHIALGICPIGGQDNTLGQEGALMSYKSASQTRGARSSTDAPKRRRTTPNLLSSSFDQDSCNHEIAKMIVQHEYPLHIVEHSGFIDYVQTLQPQFNMVSFNSIQGDCVAMYLMEKQHILSLVSGAPGHVCITLDLWTNSQSIGYAFLTGHFVDMDWKLQRRILNVVMVPSPDKDDALSEAVVTCLSDWALKSRVCTLTVDQSFTDEAMVENLRGLLFMKNPHMIQGQFLLNNCYARTLSRVALDALTLMGATVKKVRDCVKYITTSEDNEEKFLELKQQLQVPSSRNLRLDDQTKWDTTYHMLLAASEVKEVFSCFDASDPHYKPTLSMDEWKQIEVMLTYLKLLFDAANLVTGCTPPPACNFFHEIWKIQLELSHAAVSQDPFVSNLTKPLHERFDKYWKETCLVLAIAVAMDPRFKLKLVEFSFSKIFSDEDDKWVQIVDNGIHELFLEYTKAKHENDGETKMENSLGGTQDGLSDFDVYVTEINTSQNTKSELDQYLDESLLPRVQEFDVLNWWKLNRQKYPNLSRMAADVLSIPVSAVTPDSVFFTTDRKMDSYRSSLRPVALEALVCAKDWLQYGSAASSESEVSAGVAKMEHLDH